LGTHKKGVEAHFSKIAGGYDGWFRTLLGQYVERREREAVISLLEPRPGELILDVGTGTGIYLMEAVGRGAVVVGLDISRGMLGVLSKKLRERGDWVRASLVLGDAENLPIKEQVFHKIINNTTLEFLTNPEKALAEARRALMFGGSMVIGVLTSTSLWAFERRLRRAKSKNVYSYAQFYSLKRLRKLLEVSGFKVEEARWAVYAPRKTPARLIPLLEWLEGGLSVFPLVRSLGAFLAVKATIKSYHASDTTNNQALPVYCAD